MTVPFYSQTKTNCISETLNEKLDFFIGRTEITLYDKGESGEYIVYSNLDDDYLFDIVFNEINWKNSGDFDLEILLLDVSGKEVYNKILKKEELRNLYLTNFGSYSNNLIVRLDLSNKKFLLSDTEQGVQLLNLVIKCNHQTIFGKWNPLKLYLFKGSQNRPNK